MEDGEVIVNTESGGKRKVRPNAIFLGNLINNVNKINQPLYRVEKHQHHASSNNNINITYASFQAKGEVELLKLASFYGIEIVITGYNKNAEGYGIVSSNSNSSFSSNSSSSSSNNNSSSNTDDTKALKRQKILQRIAELN